MTTTYNRPDAVPGYNVPIVIQGKTYYTNQAGYDASCVTKAAQQQQMLQGQNVAQPVTQDHTGLVAVNMGGSQIWVDPLTATRYNDPSSPGYRAGFKVVHDAWVAKTGGTSAYGGGATAAPVTVTTAPPPPRPESINEFTQNVKNLNAAIYGGGDITGALKNLAKSTPAATSAMSSLKTISENAAKDRPGYYGLEGEGLSPERTVGDTKSGSIAAGLTMMSMFGMANPDYAANPELAHGTALEALRQVYSGGGATETAKSQYYGNELQKLVSRPVEQSSEYHYLGGAAGVAVPANPWELKGDYAVELLKGAPQKASEAFSPVSGVISVALPSGSLGIQQHAWNTALNTDNPNKYPKAGVVSFLQAFNVMESATGMYGPYGSLFGGPDYVGTPSSEGIRKQPDFVFTEPAYQNVMGALQVSKAERARNENGGGTLSLISGGNQDPYEIPKGNQTTSDRLVGSKMVASVAKVTDVSGFDLDSLPKPFLSTSSSTKTEIKSQTGELPFVGEIPYISPFIALFQPKREITTTTTTKPMKSVSETKEPYTIGDTTYYDTTITTGNVVNTSSTTKDLKTPFADMVASVLPEIKEKKQEGNTTFLLGQELGQKVWDVVGGPVKFAQGVVPMTPEWSKDTYTNIREDPLRGATSAAISVAIVGIGTGAKALGAGTKFLAPASKAGAAYQTASTVVSAGMIGVYGSDVLKRVTGSSISQWVPIGQTKEQQGGDYLGGIQKRFPGWEESRKQLNIVETQELLPMVAAFKVTQVAGDKIVGFVKTRNVPEIKNARASGYMADEGFPTNQNIGTRDLIDSFNTGVITSPKLSETTMAPYGEPLARIPVGTQTGAPVGQTYIYTGAEYPFLQKGFVDESASELPALFAAPQRISYFTKAGQSQSGGIGLTSDILGIYRQPVAYRSVVKSGVYQKIPADLLKIKSEGSANNPQNPRNVAIGNWMRTEAKPGVPVISQYGKAEWQYLIPSGSEVKEPKITGWYRDAGQRIPQYDVIYTGERSPLYKPPSDVIDPISGAKMRVVGKASMGVSATSVSSPSQRAIPVSSSSVLHSNVATSGSTTSKTLKSTTSVATSTKTPTKTPPRSYSVTKSKTPSSEKAVSSTPFEKATSSKTKTSTSSTGGFPSSLATTSSKTKTSASSSRSRSTTSRMTTTFPYTETTTTTTPNAAGSPTGGAIGGGFPKKQFRFVETLGFEMSRGRKDPFLSKKKKSPWGKQRGK